MASRRAGGTRSCRLSRPPAEPALTRWSSGGIQATWAHPFQSASIQRIIHWGSPSSEISQRANILNGSKPDGPTSAGRRPAPWWIWRALS
jgi:hypothetical protein